MMNRAFRQHGVVCSKTSNQSVYLKEEGSGAGAGGKHTLKLRLAQWRTVSSDEDQLGFTGPEGFQGRFHSHRH